MYDESKKNLANIVDPLRGKARSLKEGQDLKGAYENYLLVLREDMSNAEALDESNAIRERLKNRSKKVYREAIIAESLSLFEDAKENAKRNNIKGLQFYAADVGKFLSEHPEYSNKIRTIILDPARAGIAPKTLNKIINLNAERLVYVSCNPATQARDTEQLMQAGYQIKKLSLVDQFPHTAHIETVVLFEK